jgi:hypothetical protein
MQRVTAITSSTNIPLFFPKIPLAWRIVSPSLQVGNSKSKPCFPCAYLRCSENTSGIVDVQLYAFVIFVLKNGKWSASHFGEGEKNIYSVWGLGGPISRSKHGDEGEKFSSSWIESPLSHPLITVPFNSTGSHILWCYRHRPLLLTLGCTLHLIAHKCRPTTS